MIQEPIKAEPQSQVEPTHCDYRDAPTPEIAHWTRHVEIIGIGGLLAALIANGLRVFLSLLN